MSRTWGTTADSCAAKPRTPHRSRSVASERVTSPINDSDKENPKSWAYQPDQSTADSCAAKPRTPHRSRSVATATVTSASNDSDKENPKSWAYQPDLSTTDSCAAKLKKLHRSQSVASARVSSPSNDLDKENPKSRAYQPDLSTADSCAAKPRTPHRSRSVATATVTSPSNDSDKENPKSWAYQPDLSTTDSCAAKLKKLHRSRSVASERVTSPSNDSDKGNSRVVRTRQICPTQVASSTAHMSDTVDQHSLSKKKHHSIPHREKEVPSCSMLVPYYKDTHLLVKSDLQSVLLAIENHLEATPAESDNVHILRRLLSTVLKLLKNTVELYDTKLELHSFNRFLLSKFAGSDDQITFWTGFPSYSSLKYFLKHIISPNLGRIKYWGAHNKDCADRNTDKCGPRRGLDPNDELFMTLVRLKQASAHEDLAERFGISESHVSRIFVTWINFLHTVLSSIDIFMSQKKVKQTLPKVFKGLYDDVMIIIDCTEMESERPSDLKLQASTFSQYKHRNTVKALVGMAPCGVPTFISDLMEGSVSDNEITTKSGLIDRLPKGCAIMADRGWTNKQALARNGIRLITPAFLMDKNQLDLPSLVESVAIARIRIHVERCIGRIKQWKILNQKLQLSEWKLLNHIWQVCGYLVLFWPPLLD